MPRVDVPKIVVIDVSNRAEYFAKLYNAFAAGFQPSSRGNLWRDYGNVRVTVFKANGSYWWCIVNRENRKRFSNRPYETEQQALESVGAELIVV